MVVSNGEFFGLSRARQSRIAADTIRRVKSRHALARCEIDIASGLASGLGLFLRPLFVRMCWLCFFHCSIYFSLFVDASPTCIVEFYAMGR